MSYQVTQFKDLQENHSYLQGCIYGSALIPVSIIRRIDSDTVEAILGKECPVFMTLKNNGVFSYFE